MRALRRPSLPRKPVHTDLALVIFNQDLAGLHFFDDAPNGNAGFVCRVGVQPYMVTLEHRGKTVVGSLLHLPLPAQDLPVLGLSLPTKSSQGGCAPSLPHPSFPAPFLPLLYTPP